MPWLSSVLVKGRAASYTALPHGCRIRFRSGEHPSGRSVKCFPELREAVARVIEQARAAVPSVKHTRDVTEYEAVVEFTVDADAAGVFPEGPMFRALVARVRRAAFVAKERCAWMRGGEPTT